MMDYFSPTFSEFKTSNQIQQLKLKILSSSACLLGSEMGVNSVCTLKIDGKDDLLIFFRPEDKT